jgi:hypothetical protein
MRHWAAVLEVLICEEVNGQVAFIYFACQTGGIDVEGLPPVKCFRQWLPLSHSTWKVLHHAWRVCRGCGVFRAS